MDQQELIPHSFRTEFSKITSVLCKLFGIEYMEMAEDIASETFLSALETWSYRGLPANPVVWLYSVAKNKAINQLKRNHVFSKKIVPQIKQVSPDPGPIEIDLSDKNISDSQLQMLFVLCHPSISSEAQIGLALRILCGFGIEEIANAFLTNKETINKRLFRAKEILRQGNVSIEFPPEAEINKRLNAVLTTLYLLYNEGYYSESSNAILREDLCTEAMRLTLLLTEYQPASQPEVYALYSLMCFQSSRFAARKDEKGEIILYPDQDETLWNSELITKGALFLKLSSTGNKISRYHLEASIAYWHTIKIDSKEKWGNILHLYNQLLQIEYSPISALNRTFALSKVKGKPEAIAQAEKLLLTNNPYYFTLLGELYTDTDRKKAITNFETAYALAKTNADRQIIKKKIEEISG